MGKNPFADKGKMKPEKGMKPAKGNPFAGKGAKTFAKVKK